MIYKACRTWYVYDSTYKHTHSEVLVHTPVVSPNKTTYTQASYYDASDKTVPFTADTL